MKTVKNICGFSLISRADINELSAKLNIYEHKSGAKLAFIDREDNNLSFAIGFKTPPKDSTGVFHIIEHSVLCGSEKFPVKEPFVELLKGSLNTFLNAMTYEDKTVYPVASRCEKDFYNLVNIYLDAVFHPLMLEDEKIFMQEGHHLEYDIESDTLSRSGVVFNEMQGVYSSPDELSGAVISKLLFDGTMYAHDSGGAPDAIPTLTYEDFCAAHKKYYRPENAYIVLDGSINIEKIFALIDSYLSEYKKEAFNVKTVYPAAKMCPMETMYFEAGEDDDAKARLLFSTVLGRADEKEKGLAISVLMDTLAGSNEAPLKKALLDSGLCDDVSIYANKTCVNTITLELHGIEEKNADRLKSLIRATISDIIKEGIGKELILSTLNRIKFRLREKDYGSLPRGVAFALTVMESWLYDTDPAEALTYEDALLFLEEKTDTDYYEKLLCSATLDSPHRASLLMLPKKGESEISKKITEDLLKLRQNMTDLDIEAVISADKELKAIQSSPDSDDALAKIPKLSISDISEYAPEIKTDIFNIGNAEILHHDLQINGILYTELYFSAENLTDVELTGLTILSSIFTNLDTENYTATEIKARIKGSLGNFSPNALAYTDLKISGRAIPLFTLSISALTESADIIPDLIRDVLLTTKFNDTAKIKKILTQIRSATEDSVFTSGDGISIERLDGALTSAGAKNEEILGIAAYRRIKDYEKNFDKKQDELISTLLRLVKKLFNKRRLILSIAGDAPKGFTEKLLAIFPDGEPFEEKAEIQSEKISRKEAVVLPIRVSHTAMGFKSDKAAELLGALKVARSILSYEYLWNRIRVCGGAYGTGLVSRRHGTVILYSYRDPSPARTLEIFKGAADFLEDFAKSGIDLTKYIIGAYGDVDILTTPRSAARQKNADYITGWTADDEKKLRRDIISTDADALLRVAELLRKLDSASFTVVCGKDLKDTLGDISTVIP